MLKNKVTLNLKDVARRKKETSRWNELIDAIVDGRVIPVIGPEFLTEIESDNTLETANHHKQLIDVLAAACDVDENPQTFSQLIHSKSFKLATNEDKEIIYSLIPEVIDQICEQGQLRPHCLLVKLLESRLFPFVITTSFSPVVEMVMKEVWADKEVRVLQYRNDSQRDLVCGVGDIQSEKDLRIPTVYYMFGRYSPEPHRYVVTDLDMMEFCKSWLTGGSKVPRVLTEALKKKYLLVLGSNYSDWLFRFIWYSLRNTPDMMHSSLILRNDMEDSLLSFLEQLQTFIERDPIHVIDEIERRVSQRLKQEEEELHAEKPQTDVFISYSRRDRHVVRRLVKKLREADLRVWFDEDDIPGGYDWQSMIRKGIKSTRLFVPVLSHNIEMEYIEDHEYRDEWLVAAERARKMGGRTFIMPLAEKGFDFNREETKLPEEFRVKNSFWYDIADDFSAFCADICSEVTNIKEKEREVKNVR